MLFALASKVFVNRKPWLRVEMSSEGVNRKKLD
jgi:hypothetical protein